jgi:hypothetical protein
VVWGGVLEDVFDVPVPGLAPLAGAGAVVVVGMGGGQPCAYRSSCSRLGEFMYLIGGMRS